MSKDVLLPSPAPPGYREAFVSRSVSWWTDGAKVDCLFCCLDQSVVDLSRAKRFPLDRYLLRVNAR